MTRTRIVVPVVCVAAAVSLGLWARFGADLQRLLVDRDIARQQRLLVEELATRPASIRSRTTWSPAPASAAPNDSSDPRRLSPRGRLAMAKLEQYATESAAALHALGVASLMLGDATRGVEILLRASALLPEDRSVRANLGAAYLARGEPGDGIRALDLSEIATDDPAAGAAARFNTGLSAASLLTPSETMRAWRTALDAEPEPAWRAAIERHLAMASERERTAKESTAALWLRLLDHVVPRWARACLDGEGPQVRQQRREAATLAEGLLARGDHAAVSVTAPMGAQQEERDDDACDGRFARDIQQYLEGRASYRADDLAKAKAAYDRYLARSASFSKALALESEMSVAVSHYFLTRSAATIERLEAIRRQAEGERFLRLAARASWMLGYVHQDRSSFQKATDAYRRAIAAALRVNDLETVAAMEALLAATLDWMGDYRAGWSSRDEALKRLGDVADARVLHTIQGSVSRAALRDGHVRAALRFAEEGLRSARTFASPARMAEAEIDRGRIASRAGVRSVATDAVVAAGRAVGSVTAPVMAARLRAQIDEVRALGTTASAQFIDHVTRAIDTYQSAGADVALARLYLARARAYRRQQDPRAALDLRAGLRVFEEVRATLGSARWRISYFDEAWELFDEAIKFELDAGDARAALAIAERAHGRELTEALRRLRPESLVETDDFAHLDDRTRILRLIALDDRLAIWSISRSATTLHVERISSATLKSEIDETLRCLGGATVRHSCDARLEGLYDRIARPLLKDVAPDTRLILIPEGMLQMVPFAALRDRQRGRYLVEDVRLSLAATPRLRQVSLERTRLGAANRLLLVSAAPTHGPGALPYAAREAAAVGAGYRQTTVVDLAREGKSALLAALRDRKGEVLHFAGHAIPNPENPELSRLVLDVGENETDDLFAFEIADLSLSNLRVVVLAACQTAAGRTFRSEGVMSLSRAFLTAGVSSAIATLWDIPDMPAQRLFTGIHRHLREGLSADEAVRAAQLDSMAEDPGYVWASVVATTAGAP